MEEGEGGEEGEQEEKRNAGTVSSKRGPNTTAWLGKNQNPIIPAKDPTKCSCGYRSCGYRTRCTAWGGTHAGGRTGADGGTPFGATQRCTGWVKRREQGLCW
eukprot:3483529-Pyramimonas_sp.AAC.1